MKTLFVVFLLIGFSFASNLTDALLPPVHSISEYSDYLSYNDGTPVWLCWEGQYRGVWFNVEDFIPGTTVYELEETAVWFYHSASYPWDTAETYIEFWNGTSTAPEVFLEQFLITGLHYAPAFMDHSPDWIIVEPQFWIIQNTELSSGGWPSMMGDDSDLAIPHSMVSDNMTLWEPFVIESWGGSELFISTIGALPWQHGAALDVYSWGSLKTVF